MERRSAGELGAGDRRGRKRRSCRRTRASPRRRTATTLRIVAYGHSAHAGVNIEGGRNALVALARALDGLLPTGGANDLLAFARTAGADIYGTGLGITDSDPLWGRYAVNVATIKPSHDDPKLSTLTINIRRTPPRTGPQLKAKMEKFVDRVQPTHRRVADARPASTTTSRSRSIRMRSSSGACSPITPPRPATKNPKPAISGGGTYAKRLPNSIAFGMWFPDKPYPGHDVDEKNPIADLQKGTKVLIHALVDIATGPKIEKPF